MGQRLAVAALPPHRHQQRRQRPHRQRRIARLLGDDQRPAGSRFTRAAVTHIHQSPAFLGQHQHLIGGSEPGRAGEAGLRYGDELGGAVLESQRANKRKTQRGVHLSGVLPGEHRFRTG
jgi:hypothetical protein